jgi:hypothetical protein
MAKSKQPTLYRGDATDGISIPLFGLEADAVIRAHQAKGSGQR